MVFVHEIASVCCNCQLWRKNYSITWRYYWFHHQCCRCIRIMCSPLLLNVLMHDDLLLFVDVGLAFSTYCLPSKDLLKKEEQKWNTSLITIQRKGMTSTTAATSQHLSPLLWWLSKLSANPDRSHLGTGSNLTRQNWYISKPTGSHLFYYFFFSRERQVKDLAQSQQIAAGVWLQVNECLWPHSWLPRRTWENSRGPVEEGAERKEKGGLVCLSHFTSEWMHVALFGTRFSFIWLPVGCVYFYCYYFYSCLAYQFFFILTK